MIIARSCFQVRATTWMLFFYPAATHTDVTNVSKHYGIHWESWTRKHHCRRFCTARSYTTRVTENSSKSEEEAAKTLDSGSPTTELMVDYSRGLPRVEVPLPSRSERCIFVLRPITHTVGDFLKMLQDEDKGIDRAAVHTLDGVRIASSNAIDVLLQTNFKLIINDREFTVTTPPLSEVYKEETEKLSDVRNIVSQLYAVLNVEEHHRIKERELKNELEKIQAELEPMQKLSSEIDMLASRRATVYTWLGLGFMAFQFGTLARLTWWEYSWDIMEPVTYFVTYGTGMLCYAYYCVTRQEYVPPDVRDRNHLIIVHKRARKLGLDLQRYNELKERAWNIEDKLQKLQDPLSVYAANYRPILKETDDDPRQAFLRHAWEKIRKAIKKETTTS